MLTEARLIYLIIYVSDLAASRAFYEGVLGFHVLEEDATEVKYSAGHVILYLKRADDYGIQLQEGRDRSIDITFLVDNFQETRAALEARGVQFSPTLSYAVGMTADFYDPDGHWFSIYQPSEKALGWPSAEKIKALWAAAAKRKRSNGVLPAGLDEHELVYLFIFVEDPDAAVEFYHEKLGLEALEGGPCKRVVTSAPRGVVKYDAGGSLLTTHHVEGAFAARYRVTTAGGGGVAMVFHVPDVRAAVAGLSRRGVEFTQDVTPSEMGTIAQFLDLGGHVYYLCEPSAAALARPSGAAITRILTTPL